MHTDNLRARALADEACGRRNTSPSLPHLLRNRVAPITSSGCTTRGCRRAGRGGDHQEPRSRTSFEFYHPARRRTRLHQMGWLQTLAKRMKKSSDARGASPWCRPNISNPARSQAKPRATLSCRSRHLHPLTGERQRGMPRGSLRERPNVLARDAREHVFASFSYDNGPADSAGVVRHGRPSTRRTGGSHTITRGAVAETASRAALSAQTCARSGTGLSCRNVGSASPASPRLASPQPLRRSSSCCCCSTVTAAAAVAALATVARAASARGARHSARRQRKYHRRSLRA